MIVEPCNRDADGYYDLGCLSYIGKGQVASWSCWWQTETEEVQLRPAAAMDPPKHRTISTSYLAEIMKDAAAAVGSLIRFRCRLASQISNPEEFRASLAVDRFGLVGVIETEDGALAWHVR